MENNGRFPARKREKMEQQHDQIGTTSMSEYEKKVKEQAKMRLKLLDLKDQEKIIKKLQQ